MAASVTQTASDAGARSILKAFAEAPAEIPVLDIEAEAALRQFSQERLMAYGVVYADAKELRARVGRGETWLAAAQDLARTALKPPEGAVATASPTTRANRLFRASALYRMSQMMLLTDTDERRDILAQAVAHYQDASALAGDREPVVVSTGGAPLAGWLHRSKAVEAVGCAIVIGGVEGWAMDFGGLAAALALRGVHTLALDGPGQGQSRLANHHYLGPDWIEAYRSALDYLQAAFAGLPIGFVGNSMGGSVATLAAAQDPRIVACVNNGGPMHATRAEANPSFFRKMITHCGEVSSAKAVAIWGTVEPLSSNLAVACPYLVVHGGRDPLVTTAEADAAFAKAISPDKTMVTFSDGDHCIYNHEHDKLDLIGDWLVSRLIR